MIDQTKKTYNALTIVCVLLALAVGVYVFFWISDILDFFNPADILGNAVSTALGLGSSAADAGKDVVDQIPIGDGIGAIGDGVGSIGGGVGGAIGDIGGGFGF